ncbi:ABC transporter permease [Leadbettera azotonutricia]|uniref:ABC transporter, permease protein n=1 Tax=Leadbettera azotonutricia (strain ATCC BAA-888 / DSM 13862 / ZAS-9) TaxID=545695 RepID=F5Y8G7_LEAAZ|nr:ABC-2 family transporter protein [Leadbettera azotonutricia]AEF83039.1 ABC transporter, permease protein [Leadbettera azotonutricia ZAS-9]
MISSNLRFILLLIKLKLSHLMVFRLSFFGAFFADGLLFIIQIVTFSVIYSGVDSIGGWSRGQMLIFIGTFSLINALNMVIYFFGVITIPDKIRQGGLDLYLTKPVSPLLRLTFENVDPGSLPLIVLSGLIIAYGVQVEGIVPGPGVIPGYCALVILMTLLYYDMELIFRTIPFFTQSMGTADRLEGEMLNLNFKIPGVLYKGAFKIVFYFILPYGIMATVPVQFLTGTLSPAALARAAGTAILFTIFALWFWRFGLRHYKSASS